MISAVIPTYNRPHFLARLLHYFRSVGFPHSIVVADSSSSPAREANQRVVSSFRNHLRIDYKQYDPATYAFAKIAEVLGSLDSKYSVICADDDFVVPRAAQQCVDFLEDNADYGVAHGCLLGIYAVEPAKNGRQLTWGTVEPNIPTSKVWTRRQTSSTIDNDDPTVRFREHLLNYEATFYSVQRRTRVARNMKLAAELTSDFFLAELLSSCLSLIQSKLKYIEMLYGIRPYHPPDSSTKLQARQDLPDLVTSDDFSQRYVPFRDCLARELHEFGRLSLAQTNEIVNDTFLRYMTRYLRSFYADGNAETVHRFMHRALKGFQAIPAIARSAVFDGQLPHLIRAPMEFARMMHVLSAKEGYTPVSKVLDVRSPFRSDFLPIYESVMRYPHGVDHNP